ncbi:MAG: segregation and condensation protein segregation and condensation protein [Candidatus Parcubacteria bacterium]|jgi:segregation and condensation protein A
MAVLELDKELLSIKTQAFEGPLDLLLDLVERRKFLINDISLASVTDEFMEKVRQMQELSLPNTAQFVALAATLLLIKSRSLLPVLKLTEEEETDIDDLEVRLRRYQMYRDIARDLEQLFGKSIARERQFVQNEDPLFVTDKWTTLDSLSSVMGDVLVNLPKKEFKPKVQVRKVISLEEMIDRLHKRIEESVRLSFRELIHDAEERAHVIVGFLAILESVKQGSILVAQINRFDDIHIEKQSTGVPRYQ